MEWMGDADVSDEDLMLRYAAGEVAAFEQLYERNELRLWRFVLRSSPSRAQAEELLQEVWFAVAREAPRYQPRARFTTWLFTMARNRLIDGARVRRAEVSLDAEDGAGHTLHEQLPARTADGPEQGAAADGQSRAILAAVGALPPEQREAFVLQVEGGLSLAEIAAATGCSFETAKSRLRYARDKLRDSLQEYA